MDTGRLPSITDDHDVLALLTAHADGGALPTWVANGTLAAFARAGYLDADHPSRLSQLGADVAAEWAAIKARTARSWRRSGAFTPVSPNEDAARRAALRTGDIEEHHSPDPRPTWSR